jgi:CBS domain containing-hemolysin-like protein
VGLGSEALPAVFEEDPIDAPRLALRGLPDEQEGDYQTVGGLVMDQLGRIPVEGDRFGWSGFSFEVLDMDGHRVDKVLVKEEVRE